MAFWKWQEQQYDTCEESSYAGASLAGIPAYSFAEAVRAVVDAPRPAMGPQLLLLAEKGSIENPEVIPDNVKVVYYAHGANMPTVVGAGY